MICWTVCLLIHLSTNIFTNAQFNSKDEPDAPDPVAKSQEEVVERLRKKGWIKSDVIEKVMKKIDVSAYDGTYFDLFEMAGGGVVASNHHMYAYSLETLKDQLKPGNKALSVGCANGYLAVCMAKLVKCKTGGYAVCQDLMKEDLEVPREKVEDNNPELLTEENVKFVDTDYVAGDPSNGPYDAIHIGILGLDDPKPFLAQLNNGGRLVMPLINGGYRGMVVYDKDDKGEVTQIEEMGPFEISE